MDAGLRVALLAAASLALLVLAAKFHGRAVRLVREYEGYLDVDFRRRNPPFVEALWRRDRIRFWSLALVSVALGGLLLASGASASLVPEWRAGLRPIALGAFALVAWPLACAFVAEGTWLTLEQALRMRRVAPPKSSPAQDPRWARNAQRGTVLLLLTVGALGVAIARLAIP